MADPNRLAAPDADVEQGPSSEREDETTALLPPAQPSYRKRRISQSHVVQEETYRTRWWAGVAGGAVALTVLVVGGGLIALRSTHGGKVDDTPDFSKLPGPQPGLRNPNYLVSGEHGGVATEVDVCSEIGVEGPPPSPAPRHSLGEEGRALTESLQSSRTGAQPPMLPSLPLSASESPTRSRPASEGAPLVSPRPRARRLLTHSLPTSLLPAAAS